MEKVVFVFPGQGSQYIGMGKDLKKEYPIVKHIFSEADNILDYKLSKIILESSPEDLNKTIHAQPAMFVANHICLEILKEELKIIPDFIAGHSLGEYSALVTSRCLTFKQGLELVQKRARFMDEIARKNSGLMVAVIGLDIKIIKEVIHNFKNTAIANKNCPGQIGISGPKEKVEKACKILKEKGAKKIIKLSTSGAFHSPLMKSANCKFQQELSKNHFSEGEIPIAFNSTGSIIVSLEGKPKVKPQVVKNCLFKQMTNTVLWEDSIRLFIALEAKTFVEVGPKKVLCGLIKRIDPDVKMLNTTDLKEIKKTIEYLGKIRR